MTKFDFTAAAADTHKTGFFGWTDNADETDTGYVGGCNASIDWYTRRNGSNERVIRVKWNSEPVRRVKVYRNGYEFWTKKRVFRTNEELFPFTAEGLELAERFAEKMAAIPFFDRK